MSIFGFTQYIPQSVTWTLFWTPLPATSDIVKFGFNPEKYEKNN